MKPSHHNLTQASPRAGICWKQKPLCHFRIAAFSDGKPDAAPDQVRGRLFPENALMADATCLKLGPKQYDREKDEGDGNRNHRDDGLYGH
jgi:hypothetical protein